MEYEEFKSYVVSSLMQELRDNERLEVHRITKNNSRHMDGLMIMREGSCAAPVLSLNEYYQDFCDGCTLGSIVGEITDFYQAERDASGDIDVDFYKDYSSIKDHLYCKLINYEKNKEDLKNMPHVRVLDLAIVFYCRMHHETMGTIMIQIYNSHLDMWGIDTAELYKVSQKNNKRDLPPEIVTMDEIFEEMMQQDPSELSQEDMPGLTKGSEMYILTNYLRQYGAGAMLYQGVLSRFALTVGCDFYILPSSVHEVILLPASHPYSKGELEKLVKEVNETQIEEEEVLSDTVYYYSLKMKKILY